MIAQAEALRELIDGTRVDVVLVEPMFLGALPLLLDHRPRPPVVVCGIVALQITSRDTAPPGTGLAPSSAPLGRIRNLVLNRLMNGVLLTPSQRHADELLGAAGYPPSPTFVVEWVRLADLLLQCTGPSFEYPRSDLPSIVSFVGPLTPPAPAFTPPKWWEDLDGGKSVVHVTQGTIDNRDLGRLVAPTLAALADDNVLVVVTTGGPPASAIPGVLPANARVAPFLPYDQLLPKVDVMVTNGGYGGVPTCPCCWRAAGGRRRHGGQTRGCGAGVLERGRRQPPPGTTQRRRHPLCRTGRAPQPALPATSASSAVGVRATSRARQHCRGGRES